MRTVAILTNGGDTPSLNAVISSIRDNAITAGFPRILGVEDGFQGIKRRNVKLLTGAHIDPYEGGTILRSLRTAPRTDEEKRETFETLKDLEVDALVVIGGDGSLSAARDLINWSGSSEYATRILGFPRTIDNDIGTNTFAGSTEVALCPGYPSAALKIARLAKELRTTAMSTRRIFTVETMGRDAGWLATAACLGGAEFALIPEVELKEADWNRFFDRVKKIYELHKHLVIAVSEGLKFDGEPERDAAFGDRKLGGSGVRVAKLVEKGLEDRGLTVEVRCQHSDYVPRMGPPTPYDIDLASALGREMGRMLEEGSRGEMPVPTSVVSRDEISNNIGRLSIRSIRRMLFPAEDFYNRETFGVTNSFIDFLMQVVDLNQLQGR